MNKLTKKQQTILDNIRKALETSDKVLEKFHKDDNYRMVRHMQGSIESQLEGIVTYLIYSDIKAYNALEGFINEIKDRTNLTSAYAMECDSNIS
tara:strand:- start:108 stop:389 length:282 start_codon:yes stop_codon:yes gene_type:complete